MVRRDDTGDSNPPPAPRHGSLPTLKGVHPSRRDAALKPLDPHGQPMEVREPRRAVRAEPMLNLAEGAGAVAEGAGAVAGGADAVAGAADEAADGDDGASA